MTGGRTLLGPTAVYGASNILQRAIPFLLLPVLTRYLDPRAFGVVAIFMAVTQIATPLISLNVSASIRRKFFDIEGEEFAVYVTGCIVLLGLGTAIGLVLAALIGGQLERFVGLDPKWVPLAVAHAGAQALVLVVLTLWQVEDRPVRYAVVQILRSACTAALTLVLVISFDLGVSGALLGLAGTSGLFVVVVAGPALFPLIRRHVDREAIRHAVRYGGGLVPHMLGAIAITSADRFFITHYVGTSETGLYWIGYQIGFVVSLCADAFNRAWSPWLFSKLKAGDDASNRAVMKSAGVAFGAFATLALVVTLAAPLITKYLLAPEFASADRFVMWIAVGFALNGMYRLVAGVIFFSEKTMALSKITVGAAVLNLGLNAILVPRFGAIGAAQATAAAFLMSFVATLWLVRRIRA